MTSMSVEQYRREILKQSEKHKAAKHNKFNAQKVEMDGMTFDSKKEAERYGELSMLQCAGKISCLARQCQYVVLDDYILGGKKHRGITYIADFEYLDENKIIHTEDVKGVRTDVYKLKKKLFESRYHRTIEEI